MAFAAEINKHHHVQYSFVAVVELRWPSLENMFKESSVNKINTLLDIQKMLCVCAVSYTHLDVYKRQRQCEGTIRTAQK